jgi:hypothetical protein
LPGKAYRRATRDVNGGRSGILGLAEALGLVIAAREEINRHLAGLTFARKNLLILMGGVLMDRKNPRLPCARRGAKLSTVKGEEK